MKMPRRMRPATRSGYDSAYASARVLPQEPPNSNHRSIPSSSRRASISDTRCQVVFSSRSAWGVLFPHPPVRRQHAIGGRPPARGDDAMDLAVHEVNGGAVVDGEPRGDLPRLDEPLEGGTARRVAVIRFTVIMRAAAPGEKAETLER